MNKKFSKTKPVSFLITCLFLFSLACGSFTNSVKEEDKTTVNVEPTAIEVKPVESATPKKEVEKKKTTATKAKPTATETPVVEEPEAMMTESWRIPGYKGAILMAYDQTPNLDPGWNDVMDKQARNLAIPSPYYFEIYQLETGTKFGELRDYYNKIITGNGMTKALDTMDGSGIGVVTWIDPSKKTRKYLVQYIPGDSTTPPLYFIMYSNPK